MFIRQGLLPAYRVGKAGNIRIDLNDVDALITGDGPVQTGIEVPTEREQGSGRFTGSGAA